MLLILDAFIAIYLLSSMLCVSLCCILAVLKPRGFIFVGQLIPKKYYYLPVSIVLVSYHIYLMTAVALNALVLGCATIVYCFYVAMVTNELRHGRRKYESEDSLRTFRNTMHVYRCLQLFHANVICLFGPYLAVFNAIFMAATIFVSFVLMRYWEVLGPLTKTCLLLINFILLIFYLTILELGCIFCVGGIKMFRSWKKVQWSQNRLEKKKMKAFQRSCRPILLCWGTHFVIGRQSIIVYGKGVVRGTFRALLTTQ